MGIHPLLGDSRQWNYNALFFQLYTIKSNSSKCVESMFNMSFTVLMIKAAVFRYKSTVSR